MNELSIPTLISSGRNNKFLRISFYIMLILALLLHIGVFTALGYFGKHPFIFLFPDDSKPINKEEHLNYVLVDDKLIDEEVKDETPKTLGKVSRKSRDEIIDPNLPKSGPISSIESSVSSFSNGSPLPDAIAAPEISPSPPPIPDIKPQKTSSPTPVVKTVSAPKPVEQAKEQLLPNLPELDIQEDLTGILPEIKNHSDSKEIEKSEEITVTGINASDEISKMQEEPTKQPEEQKQPAPEPVAANKPVEPQKKIPTRKIPVRQIGSKSSVSGGKIQKRLNSSAINAGSKSIAVLRSRYGDYMDKILRRIQQAIIIQQQINPISMHEGNVIMSFTINSQGILDQIQFLDSAPHGITTEISAARSVLLDVQNTGPFDPPTQQMLNDPDFQSIIINFVFESR